jgi:hypothetical protein
MPHPAREVLDDRAARDRQHEVVARCAVTLGALSVCAARGAEVTPVAIRGEIAQGRVGDHHDVAPLSPVAAVGTAAGHMRLAAKAHATVAAGSRLDVDGGAVIKHEASLAEQRNAEVPETRDSATGITAHFPRPPITRRE